MPLNVHCQVQPGKWSTASEQGCIFYIPTPKILTDAADFPESFKITLGEKFLCYDSRSHFPVGLLSCHTIELGDSEEL